MMPQKLQSNMQIDIERIQKMLPHRYPFLLVDRVVELKENNSVVAIKNVTYNEPFFQGHFPNYKIMPGVLIIEALAQAGGILIYKSIPDPERKIVFLSKVANAKFRKPVIPGDQLRFEVKLIKQKNRFCHVKGQAFVKKDLVAEAEIMASLINLEELNGNE